MLADTLKTLLASTFAYRIKAQAFHWNVEGFNFESLHEMFGEIYEDADNAIDPLAEYIRTLDEYAPGSFKRYSELSIIKDQLKVPKWELMVKELHSDTMELEALLVKAFAEATTEKKDGVANFIADRQTAHGKYRWQLGALMK